MKLKLIQHRGIASTALVLLVSALTVPGDAQAQSEVPLVSNLTQNIKHKRASDPGQGKVSAFLITGDDVSQTRVAQRFQTGTAAFIRLSNVEIGHYGKSVASEHRYLKKFSVRVCGVFHDNPNSTCTNLSAPSGDFGWRGSNWIGRTSFTAPSNTMLSANTAYFVEIYDFTGPNSLATTTSNGEDPASLSGWTIQNELRFQGSSGVWRTQTQHSVRIVVWGTANTNLQVAAPTIEGAPALSDAGSDGDWTPGETVQVTLAFSEAVNVDTSAGTPSIGLELGGTEARSASYASGSGTTELVFSYTLSDADGTHSSMLVPENSLTLNGGTITSASSGADAVLEHLGAARASIGGL